MNWIRGVVDEWKLFFTTMTEGSLEKGKRLMGEFVAGTFQLEAPGRAIREAEEAMREAVARRDGKAGLAFLTSMFGAAQSARWRKSPAGKKHYELDQRNRDRLAQKNRKYEDGRPPRPSFDEAFEIAQFLLADPYAKSIYDPKSGLKPVSNLLAQWWLSERDQEILEGFLQDSKKIPFFWDIIECIDESFVAMRATPPPALLEWRAERSSGRRQRPPEKKARAHRRREVIVLVRNVKAWLAIKELNDLGYPPTGGPKSESHGCLVVGKVLHLTESYVRNRIWHAYGSPWEMVQRFVEITVEDVVP